MSEDPRLEFKPDPLVRQSDLDLHTEKERREHLKTRAVILVLAGTTALKYVPFLAGYLGWHPW